MKGSLQILFVTIVFGIAAFVTGPMIWPASHEVSMPPPGLLPLYILLAVFEALAFGFSVAFAAFGWAAIRDLRLGARWLNKMLFVTLIWFTGNWWIHDNLHMHVGLDLTRLFYIEYAFHMSMLACGVTLAFSWMRLARQGALQKT